MKFPAVTSRGIVGTLALAGLAGISATPGQANPVIEQDVVRNAVQNILWTVRDQIQNRRLTPPAPGAMRFTGEESEFDNKRPFEQNPARHAFDALGYAKAPAMAAAPLPTWLYGVNAIGAYDETLTAGVVTKATSGTGAFDATKIGIFTASDALTFVVTGSGIWARTFGVDIDTAAGAGTVAYTNGGFSADFTTAATWSRASALNVGIAAPPNTSSVSYTGNVQYKYDLLYGAYIEPTIGVTYTELYTANFGAKTGDSTELHGGGRIGTEMNWMSFKVQPQLSVAAFRNVDQSGVLAGAGPGLPIPVAAATSSGMGYRGAARVNVIWTPNFSSFLDVHGSGIAGTNTTVATQTVGGSAGMRYSW
ncbi:hypothetical protein LJR220_007121 [Bradyrhizobium sp. LjRoot220]|uniref:hypothetical protein n=1 Tax=Bradyrhizobium sp. LjRoot220 TaxID=3342284 RepID=UPI003ECD5CEE